jgi:hypothetical protein
MARGQARLLLDLIAAFTEPRDEARQIGVAETMIVRPGRGEANARARSLAELEIELPGDPAEHRRLQP